MQHHRGPESSPPSAPRHRILVVDDDAAILQLLRELLEDEGFVVLPAADGEPALALALETPPDLVLTDLMLPHLDGRALFARLREHPTTAHIPVLLMTAAGQARHDDGFAAFIPKPFTIDLLLDQISASSAGQRMSGRSHPRWCPCGAAPAAGIAVLARIAYTQPTQRPVPWCTPLSATVRAPS